MEKTVTAREANQNFSRLLAEAEKGMEIVITKRGKEVARLTPGKAQVEGLSDEQEAAWQRTLARSARSKRIADWTFDRAALHER